MKKSASSLALMAATTLVGSVYAADITDGEFETRFNGAVDELNAKLEVGYVHYDFGDTTVGSSAGSSNFWDDGSGIVVEGAVSAPLGQNFGIQIDAGYFGSHNIEYDGGITGFTYPDGNITATGVGGHLFWRDATVGLIGVYAHHVHYDLESSNIGDGDIANTRLEAEAEGYIDRFTIKGSAGIDQLYVNGLGDDEFFTASGEIDYYLTDNVMVMAGVRHSFEQTSAVVGAEAMFDTGSASSSAFAEASFGDDATAVNVGIKLYFGKQAKTLIERHREDDPSIGLFDAFADIASCLSFLTPVPESNNQIYTSVIGGYQSVQVSTPQLEGCDTRQTQTNTIYQVQ